MPAPFLSGTAAPENYMFSTASWVPAVTQMAFPFEMVAGATRCARPPTPRRVRLLVDQVTAGPLYVPASISTTSPLKRPVIWLGSVNWRPGPTCPTRGGRSEEHTSE